MSSNPDVLRPLLKKFDFKALFNQLGWEHHLHTLHVAVDNDSYTLDAVAHKRGMAIYVCRPGPTGALPDSGVRRRICREVVKVAHEHILIFTDGDKTTQVWQWVRKRQAGRPAAFRQRTYHRDQPGDSLLQKLHAIRF